MKKTRKVFCLIFAFAFTFGNLLSTSYAAVHGEDQTLIYDEPLDFESEEFILLESFTIPIPNAAVTDAALVPASDLIDVELEALAEIYQKSGTTQIFTQVTVRSTYWGSGVQVCSFYANVLYVNCTNFDIPDCSQSFTARTNSPSNRLTGSVTSPAQRSGDTISVSVTVSDVVLGNIVEWESPTVHMGKNIKIR